MNVEHEGQPDRIKHSVNPAFQGAWWKGFSAGVTGKTRHVCPYKKGRRTKKKPGTFRLAFRAFWMNGWQSGKNHRAKIEKEYFLPWTKVKRSRQLDFSGMLDAGNRDAPGDGIYMTETGAIFGGDGGPF